MYNITRLLASGVMNQQRVSPNQQHGGDSDGGIKTEPSSPPRDVAHLQRDSSTSSSQLRSLSSNAGGGGGSGVSPHVSPNNSTAMTSHHHHHHHQQQHHQHHNSDSLSPSNQDNGASLHKRMRSNDWNGAT